LQDKREDAHVQGSTDKMNVWDFSKIITIILLGDFCILPNNKEKAKRRVEARTTRKAIIIMTSFICCRVPFLLVIIFRQISSLQANFFSPLYVLTAQQINKVYLYFLFELILLTFSYISCFLNSFTFMMVTENVRNEAKDYIFKFYLFIKTKIFHRQKTNRIAGLN
jgi:hypothetical protein